METGFIGRFKVPANFNSENNSQSKWEQLLRDFEIKTLCKNEFQSAYDNYKKLCDYLTQPNSFPTSEFDGVANYLSNDTLTQHDLILVLVSKHTPFIDFCRALQHPFVQHYLGNDKLKMAHLRDLATTSPFNGYGVQLLRRLMAALENCSIRKYLDNDKLGMDQLVELVTWSFFDGSAISLSIKFTTALNDTELCDCLDNNQITMEQIIMAFRDAAMKESSPGMSNFFSQPTIEELLREAQQSYNQ